jgi:membrane protein
MAFTSYRIIRRAIEQFGSHHVSAMGAALAYYALFSIGPLLILALRVAGNFYDEERVRAEFFTHLEEIMPEESANGVLKLIDQLHKAQAASAWGPRLGLVLLLAGSLGIFLHIRSSLCRIWELEPPRGSSILGLLLNYALAILMILVTGLLLLASLAISTTLTLVEQRLDEWLPGDPARWYFLEFAISLAFLTIVFALVYQILSGRRLAWRYVWYGAVITALLFTLGKTLLSWYLYLAYSSTMSVYGAAGSIVVFMVWVFYSSQILFFGAELIQARRTRREWLDQGNSKS